MTALTNIPSSVRTALYLAGWIVGSLSGGITAVWAAVAAASPDISMPLWLVVTAAALQFLAAQLNLVSTANVPSQGDAVPPRGQRGAVDVITVLVIALIVVAILVLLGFLR